ncbi:MAG: hypothetical protein K2Y18_01530 [Alphaproteobacteria bacterium]|jgi:hypothetical protein|nr:hypothetical protein [Alphaproteobacteria bacterium]
MIFNNLNNNPDPLQPSLISLFLNLNIKRISLIIPLLLSIWFTVPLSAADGSYGMYRTDQHRANVIGPQFVNDELLDDNSIRISSDDRRLDYTLPTNVDELRLFLNSSTEKDLEEFGSRQKDGGKVLFTIFEQYFQIPLKDRLFSKNKFYLVPHPRKLNHALDFILWAPYLTALRTSAKLGFLPAVRILAHNSFLFIEYNAEKEASPLPDDQEILKEFLKNQPIDDLGRSAFFTPHGAKLLYDFFFTYFAYPRDSRAFVHPEFAQSVEELKTKEPGRLVRNYPSGKAAVQVKIAETDEHFKLCKLALFIASWLHHPKAQSFIDRNPDFFPDNRKPYPFVNSFVDLQTDKALLLSLKNMYLEDKCLASARYVLQKLISLCLKDLTSLPPMLVEMNSFFHSTQTIEGFLTSEQLTSIPERLDPIFDTDGFAEIDKLKTLCSLINEYKTILSVELESKRQAGENSARLYGVGRAEYSQDLSKKLAYYTDFKDHYLFYFRVFGDDVPLEDYRLASDRFFEAAQDLVVTAKQVSVPDQEAYEKLKTELYRLGTEFTKRVFTFYGDEQPPRLAVEEYLRFAKKYSDALCAISQDKELKAYAWRLVKSNLQTYMAQKDQAHSTFSAIDFYQLYTLFKALGDHMDASPSNDDERLKHYGEAFKNLDDYFKQGKTMEERRDAAQAYLSVASIISSSKNRKLVKVYCKRSTDLVDEIMSDSIAKVQMNYFFEAKRILTEAMILNQGEHLFVDECYTTLANYIDCWIAEHETKALLSGPNIRVAESDYKIVYEAFMLVTPYLKHNPALELNCYLKALDFYTQSLPRSEELSEEQRRHLIKLCFDFGDTVTDPLGRARLYKKGMEGSAALHKLQKVKTSRQELLAEYTYYIRRALDAGIPEPTYDLYWKNIRYMAEAAKEAAFCSDNETMLKWCKGALEYAHELEIVLPHPYYPPPKLYGLIELLDEIIRCHPPERERTKDSTQRSQELVQHGVRVKSAHQIIEESLPTLSETVKSTKNPRLPVYLKKALGLFGGLPRKARGLAIGTTHHRRVLDTTSKDIVQILETDKEDLLSLTASLKEKAGALRRAVKTDSEDSALDLDKTNQLLRAGILYENRAKALGLLASDAVFKATYLAYKDLYFLISTKIWPNFLTQVKETVKAISDFHEKLQTTHFTHAPTLIIAKRTKQNIQGLLKTVSEVELIDGFDFVFNPMDPIAPTLSELGEEFHELYLEALEIDQKVFEVQKRTNDILGATLHEKLAIALRGASSFISKTIDHPDWKPADETEEETAYKWAYEFQTLVLRYAPWNENIWNTFDQALKYHLNSLECPHTREKNPSLLSKAYYQRASELKVEAEGICPFDQEGNLLRDKENSLHQYVFLTYLCANVTQKWVDSLDRNTFLKNFEMAAENHINAYLVLRKAKKTKCPAYSENRTALEQLRLIGLYTINQQSQLDVQWLLVDVLGDFVTFAAKYLKDASKLQKNPSDLIGLAKCSFDTATCRRDPKARYTHFLKCFDYAEEFLKPFGEKSVLDSEAKFLINDEMTDFLGICRSFTEMFLVGAKNAPQLNEAQDILWRITEQLTRVGINVLPVRDLSWDDVTYFEITKIALLEFSQAKNGYTPMQSGFSTPNTPLTSPRPITSPRPGVYKKKEKHFKDAEELTRKLEAERLARLSTESSSNKAIPPRVRSRKGSDVESDLPSAPSSPVVSRAQAGRTRSNSVDSSSQDRIETLQKSPLKPKAREDQANQAKGASRVPRVKLANMSPQLSPQKQETPRNSKTPRTPTTPGGGTQTPTTPKSPKEEAASPISRSSPPKVDWYSAPQGNPEGLTFLGRIVDLTKRRKKTEMIISPSLRADTKKNDKKSERPKSTGSTDRLSSRTSPRISGARSKDIITPNVRKSDETTKFKDG